MDYAKAAILGLLEGLTEFIPVSSTGHLLLLGHFLGFTEDSLGKSFAILIQLGAILAILGVYFGRLLAIASALPTDPVARRFVVGVLVGFLPAMVLGYLFRDFIKSTLFDPVLVCCALIAGGLILLVVDETDFDVRHHDAKSFPLPMYLKIGLFQCLAMVPGVSRSGATIVGALIMGADKRAATEFSFFLAMPTMVGAFSYELFKTRKELSADGMVLIAIGFAVSFVAGLFVVRYLLDYVSKHGFGLFAWWRILVGSAGLLGLWLVG